MFIPGEGRRLVTMDMAGVVSDRHDAPYFFGHSASHLALLHLHVTMRALAALTLVAAVVPLEAQFGMPPKEKSIPSKGAPEN